jgi:hypothetical protein
MAKADDSAIEKSALAVSSGSLMLVALLLAADGMFGSVFGYLNSWISSGLVTAVAIPVLTVAYMLGIMVTTGSELAHKWSRTGKWPGTRKGGSKYEPGPYLFKEQDVFEVVSKNDMLLKQFDDLVRYRRILLGSFFPLFSLGVGLSFEILWRRYQDAQGLLISSAVVALVLAAFSLLFLQGLDFALNQIWDVGRNSLEPNLSLSVKCFRKPLRDDLDCLTIKVKLEKQDRWTIPLHDIQARVYERKEQVTWAPLPDFKPIVFKDVFRVGFKCDPTSAWPPVKGTISWDERSNRRRFITLTPGDSMELSDTCELPSGKIYKVEVVVLSLHHSDKEFNDVRAAVERNEPIDASRYDFSQWRSSNIVHPCCPTLEERSRPLLTELETIEAGK